MTSLVCGLAAACCWALGNVVISQVTRDPEPCELAFWISALALALSAPLGLAQLPSAHVSIHDLAMLALAGAAAAATVRLLAVALAHGQLGVVGPLQSLEGLVAAGLVVAFGGGVAGSTLVGGLLAGVGGATVGLAASRKGHLTDAALALPAAACAGVTLWALGQQSLTPVLAYMLMRAASVLALAPSVADWRVPRHLRWLLLIAALDLVADLVYLLGVRAGSLAVTAVLASQFGTLTALGGVWRWSESLNAAQIAGLVVLGCGIAIVAAGGT